MQKRTYKIIIRNTETGELKKVSRKAYTIDEAEDRVLNSIEYPWVLARFETIMENMEAFG